jgi:hypothetical protein
MQDTIDAIKARIAKYCPYKSRHFCDGKPNMSMAKEGEEMLPKSPCHLNKICPVRKPWLIGETNEERTNKSIHRNS